MLNEWLAHPLTRGLDIDDPRTTHLRRRVIREKKFLRRVYGEWYARLAADVPEGAGAVLELGSGAGFLKEYVPGLITSEVFPCPGVQMVLDATRMPFADRSLRAVLMTNVLHHIADARRFFSEATRCVRPGGVVAMVEPWVTPWSRFVNERLHHEPFEPSAREWKVPATGPLSGANGALPWILFERDREQFRREFTAWELRRVEPLMPLSYLVSGGVSTRDLMPGWTFPAWRALETLLNPLMDKLAMFAHVVLARAED